MALRYVPIPCPSGQHQQSILTFRNHTVAALFCLPCEHAWTVSTSHPALVGLPVTNVEHDEPSGES